ncbi:MAG: Flp pilus assembly protein CpaB [Geodermatophilaceae bacterium]|nr:Flp pilus assembly protein CpaB [Geodermatophilaceae bacterium]
MRQIDRIRLTAWRWVRWGRRLLALGLLATAAVLAATEEGRDELAEPTVEVLVASRELAAGTVLGAGDVAARAWPIRLVPDGTLTPADDPAGRLLAGAIRAGEAVTDVRLLGPGLVQALEPGLRAVPVRLTDAGVGALLRTGDRIDLYAVSTGIDAQSEQSTLVAAYALVLAVPAEQDTVVPEGGIIVVAVPSTTALKLVAAAYTQSIAATLAPP